MLFDSVNVVEEVAKVYPLLAVEVSFHFGKKRGVIVGKAELIGTKLKDTNLQSKDGDKLRK